MTDQRKLEITNTALLALVNELEESVSYWRAETDKAWQTTDKWVKAEANKSARALEELDALHVQIEALGALIPVNTGGTMENDPPDAILDQAIRFFTL